MTLLFNAQFEYYGVKMGERFGGGGRVGWRVHNSLFIYLQSHSTFSQNP